MNPVLATDKVKIQKINEGKTSPRIFWEPDAAGILTAPEVLSAETNGDGTQIFVKFTTDISSPASNEASNFKISTDGSIANGAITAITADGTDGIILTVTSGIVIAGQDLTIGYTPGNIESDKGEPMVAFSDVYVKNSIAGNSIILDDCEDGNSMNQMGGVWFTYNDHEAMDGTTPAPGASIITPLTSKENPFKMADEGADGSSKSAYVDYTLDVGQWVYRPFVGLGLKFNPEGEVQDLSAAEGISFYYKGSTCRFQVKLTTVGGGADHPDNRINGIGGIAQVASDLADQIARLV